MTYVSGNVNLYEISKKRGLHLLRSKGWWRIGFKRETDGVSYYRPLTLAAVKDSSAEVPGTGARPVRSPRLGIRRQSFRVIRQHWSWTRSDSSLSLICDDAYLTETLTIRAHDTDLSCRRRHHHHRPLPAKDDPRASWSISLIIQDNNPSRNTSMWTSDHDTR